MLALIFIIIFGLALTVTIILAIFSSDYRTQSIIASVIFAGIMILIIGFSCVAIIPNGHIAVMTKFGKVTGEVLDSGFNWKSMIEDPVTMSIQTQKYEVDCEAASKDLQDVTNKIAVNYKLDRNKAVDVYRTIGLNYFEVIGHPAIQEVVKAVTSQYNAEDMILKRETVKGAIADTLSSRLWERGVISEHVNITNFSFSREFTAAIESKVSAAQSVLQSQNKLEQIKVEAEQAKARAEGEKNASILQAEGQKQSSILKAEGEAQKIKIVTEAQVESNKKISETLNSNILQYNFIDRMGDNVDVWVVPNGQGLVINPAK